MMPRGLQPANHITAAQAPTILLTRELQTNTLSSTRLYIFRHLLDIHAHSVNMQFQTSRNADRGCVGFVRRCMKSEREERSLGEI
jgi:hypothetical protein